MKMIIHKDKMLWYNTGYCIKVIKKDKEDLQEEYRKMKLGIVVNQPFFINLYTSIKVRKTAWLQSFLKL